MAASSFEHVRLPKDIDPFVGADVSVEVLRQKVQNVSSNLPPLLPRNWISVDTESTLNKNEDSKDNETEKEIPFRVMQFNILAEGLSMGGDIQPPFTTQTDGSALSESTYGGFSEVNSPEVCFNFEEVRRWRLLEEIIRVDADIISLEEIDRFHDFFEPALKKLGYDGIFSPKANSPSCKFGYFSDGVALFWRSNKFQPLSSVPSPPPSSSPSSGVTEEGASSSSSSSSSGSSSEGSLIVAQTPSPAVVSALRHTSSSRVFVVGVTHLKAKPGAVNEERRKNQIDFVLGLMDRVANAVDSNNRPGLILLGDFNTDSFDVISETKSKKALKRMLSLESNDGEEDEANNEASVVIPAQAVPHVVAWRGGELVSVYPLSKQQGEGFTTWKKRGTLEVQHTIDYIFYSTNRFRVTKILDSPNVSVIPESRFPCLEYPSDHLSIAADMIFI